MKVIIDNYAAMLKRGEVLPKDKLLYVQKLALDYKSKKEQYDWLESLGFEVVVASWLFLVERIPQGRRNSFVCL